MDNIKSLSREELYSVVEFLLLKVGELQAKLDASADSNAD